MPPAILAADLTIRTSRMMPAGWAVGAPAGRHASRPWSHCRSGSG